MIILAIRNPRGMNFIHPTRDLLLQALSKPVAFSSFHFIQIGSHYLTTLACRDPHCTFRISPLRSATTSPHVGRSFIQVSIDQFPFLVAPHFMGTLRATALHCFQRALSALVVCVSELPPTRWHKPCDDWCFSTTKESSKKPCRFTD